MPRGSHLPRNRRDEPEKHSYDGDDGDGGGIGDCLASILQWPVVLAASIIVPIFALTFIIMGSVFFHKCRTEPMVPVWLIVQGVIMLFGIGTGGLAKRLNKPGSSSSSSTLVKILSFIVALFTTAWFIAGNVWVYQAWGKSVDYGHEWFENACDKSLYRVAFWGVIVLDALFGISIIVACIAFVLRGCKTR